ncbi:MAG: tetratricopeptide repeat protein, partial [Planctomycetota bacterium]
LHRAALELQRPLLPPHHPALAGSENALANALFELGETEEAAALWRSALATFEAVLDPGHPDLVTVLANLSLVHERAREFDEARALLARATELRRTALGPAHPRTRALERRRADLELAAGDPEAACRLAGAVLVAERAAVDGVSGSAEEPLGLEQALFSLALAERSAGRTGDARSHLEECLALQEQRLAPDHLELAQGRTLLGSLYLLENEPAAAAEVLEAAVRVRRAKLPGHWLTANTESLYGAALLALGEVERAAPLLLDAVPVLERALGADDYRTREARARALELP